MAYSEEKAREKAIVIPAFSKSKKKINMNEKQLETDVHRVLTTNIIKLLRSKNISSLLDFTEADSSVLVNISGLSLREILDVKKVILVKYAAKPIKAIDFYKIILASSALIPTGIKGLDSILQGGLLTGNIYEMCGLPASGKTYLCHSVLKHVVEGTYDNVYFIDTKENFSGLKMKQMLAHLDKEKLAEAMNKILIRSAFTAGELLCRLCNIITDLDSGLRTRVIIVDSLAALLLLYEADSVSERNRILTHIANVMRYIVHEYHVAILVTNLMTLWNDGDFKNTDEYQEKLACGRFWHSIPNARFKIEKNENNQGKITLTKFMKGLPNLTECSVNFTDVGIE